jgi:opacity protein-like surface antigen
MRKVLFTALLAALLLARTAAAQEVTPRVELFGGYSFAGGNFHGWHASVAGNVNRWFGLAADFTGHYGGATDEDGFDERERIHGYHFGPRFSARGKRVTVFAHALFGASSLRTSLTGFGQRFEFADTAFSFVLGGGLDIKVGGRVSIRAFQLDYLRARLFGGIENRGRLACGLVLRLGKK